MANSLLIDPYKEEITLVQWDRSLNHLLELIDCKFMERITDFSRQVLYVDGEGALPEPPKKGIWIYKLQFIEPIPVVLYGKAMLCRESKGKNPRILPLKKTPLQLKAELGWETS